MTARFEGFVRPEPGERAPEIPFNTQSNYFDLTFEDVHVNTGWLGIGRGTRVVALVADRRVLHGQNAGLVPIGRDGDSVLVVVVDHPGLVVPAKANNDGGI